MQTLSTQLQMNSLNSQSKIQPSLNLLPAQFTYQPVSMSDSRGNLPNSDAIKTKKNIIDILMKKMNSTKTASGKLALHTVKSQDYIQTSEHISQQTALENLLKKSQIQGGAQRTAASFSNGMTF
jgi:hypothetical protein